MLFEANVVNTVLHLRKWDSLRKAQKHGQGLKGWDAARVTTTMTLLGTLGHFPSSHPSMVFNLGEIKGRIHSCTFQHKSIKSGMILGLKSRSYTWAWKGHLSKLLVIIGDAKTKGFRASGQRRFRVVTTHPISSFWPYISSSTSALQPHRSSLRFQVKPVQWIPIRWPGFSKPAGKQPCKAPLSKSHRVSWTQVTYILPDLKAHLFPLFYTTSKQSCHIVCGLL